MKIKVLFIYFLFPILMLGQNGIQDASKGIKVSISGGQLVGNGFNNAEIITIGSKFYHNEWMKTRFNEDTIYVKYDAFEGEMRVSSGQKILAVNGQDLKFENGEVWVSVNTQWYKLLSDNNNQTILYKPFAVYRERRTARSSYEIDTPAKYIIKNEFYKLESGIPSALSKKEIKQRGLKKREK
jgi:hypothetical protein